MGKGGCVIHSEHGHYGLFQQVDAARGLYIFFLHFLACAARLSCFVMRKIKREKGRKKEKEIGIEISSRSTVSSRWSATPRIRISSPKSKDHRFVAIFVVVVVVVSGVVERGRFDTGL